MINARNALACSVHHIGTQKGFRTVIIRCESSVNKERSFRVMGSF